MNASMRQKRVAAPSATANTAAMSAAAYTAPTDNDFHRVRAAEQARTHAMTSHGATEAQVAPSYFTDPLQQMAAQQLADHFAERHEVDALREEQPALYAMVLERLPTEPDSMLPLRLTVPRIADERYWQRCCEARWSLGQLSRMAHGEKLLGKEYGWKRLYLERVVADFLQALGSGPHGAQGDLLPPLERSSTSASRTGKTNTIASSQAAVDCTPEDADPALFDLSLDEKAIAALRELCAICRDYVHTIDLPCQLVHLRLHEHLFAHMPGILSLRLTYGAAGRGVWDMIGFRDEDAADLRQLLRQYTALECLRLPLNRLQDRHALMIAAGLAMATRLRVLDLSQNSLTDLAAVQAVAVLLGRPDFPLEELDLHDNDLGDVAAAELAMALRVNKTLRVLDLHQNRLGNGAGAEALLHALAVQPTLVEVRLGNNGFGPRATQALTEVLPELTQLRVLSIAGNSKMAGAAHTTTVAAASMAAVVSAKPAFVPIAAPVGAETVPTITGATDPSMALVLSMDLPTEHVESSEPSAASATLVGDAERSTMAVTVRPALPQESSADVVAVTPTPGASASAVRSDGGGAGDSVASSVPTSSAHERGKPVSVAEVSADAEVVAAPASPAAVIAAPVAGASDRVVLITEGGSALTAAVLVNTSLMELDVRFCGFTTAEEAAMMEGVRSRVFQQTMDTTVAAVEAEQRRELQQRAEARVARMTGRVL